MKRKFLIALLSVVAAASLTVGLAACSSGTPSIEFEIGSDGHLYGTIDGERHDYGPVVGSDGADGQDGTNGTNGTNGVDGVGIETAEINDDGELVITLTDGTELNLGVVVGADGEDGKDGTNGRPGADGQRGSKWFYGSDMPNEHTFAERLIAGDMYLCTANNTIWYYEGGEWTAISSFPSAGNKDTVYIMNENDLTEFAKAVNASTDGYKDYTVELMNDIDLEGVEWTPIGTSGTPFKGTFNGNGNTISNLTVESEGGYVGLFGNIDSTSLITDFTLENVTVSGTTNVGAVVGNIASSAPVVSDVTVNGATIEAESNMGGVVGNPNSGTVKDCVVTDLTIVATPTNLTAALGALEEGATLALSEGEYDTNLVMPALDSVTVVGAGADKTTVNGYIQFNNATTSEEAEHVWNISGLTVNNVARASQIAININGNSKLQVEGSELNITDVDIINSEYGVQVASSVRNMALNLDNVTFDTVWCAISVRISENNAEPYGDSGNTFTATGCTYTDVTYQLQEFFPNNYYEVIGGTPTAGTEAGSYHQYTATTSTITTVIGEINALENDYDDVTLVLEEGTYSAIEVQHNNITIIGAGAGKTIVNDHIFVGTSQGTALDAVISGVTVQNNTNNYAAITVHPSFGGETADVAEGNRLRIVDSEINNVKWGVQLASGVKNTELQLENVTFNTVGCAISVANSFISETATGNSLTVGTGVEFNNVAYQLQTFYPNLYYTEIGGTAIPSTSNEQMNNLYIATPDTISTVISTIEALTDDNTAATLLLAEGNYSAININHNNITIIGAGAEDTVVTGHVTVGTSGGASLNATIKGITVTTNSENYAAITHHSSWGSNVTEFAEGNVINVVDCVITDVKWGVQISSSARNLTLVFDNVTFDNVWCAISVQTNLNDATYTSTNCGYEINNVTFTDVTYQLQTFFTNNYYVTIGGEVTNGSTVTVPETWPVAEEETEEAAA